MLGTLFLSVFLFHFLNNERNNRLATLHNLLVGLTACLDVAAVLFQRPLCHLRTTRGREHPRAQNPGADAEPNPRHDLEEVVGARHKLEQCAFGDGALLVALRRAHARELQMNGAVEDLTNKHQNRTGVQGVLRGRGVQRVTQKVPNKRRKAPVVNAVLEDVEERHRWARELMNKERLELTLHKVCDEHADVPLGEPRQLAGGCDGLGAVDERRTHRKRRHDRDRSRVLNDKHCTVPNLWPEVLVRDAVAVFESVRREGLGVVVEGDGVLLERGLKGLAVDRDGGAEGALEVEHCGGAAHVNLGFIVARACQNDKLHSFYNSCKTVFNKVQKL
eukprot:PhM_4_TR13645/c0_g1_i1/m.67567